MLIIRGAFIISFIFLLGSASAKASCGANVNPLFSELKQEVSNGIGIRNSLQDLAVTRNKMIGTVAIFQNQIDEWTALKISLTRKRDDLLAFETFVKYLFEDASRIRAARDLLLQQGQQTSNNESSDSIFVRFIQFVRKDVSPNELSYLRELIITLSDNQPELIRTLSQILQSPNRGKTLDKDFETFAKATSTILASTDRELERAVSAISVLSKQIPIATSDITLQEDKIAAQSERLSASEKRSKDLEQNLHLAMKSGLACQSYERNVNLGAY